VAVTGLTYCKPG